MNALQALAVALPGLTLTAETITEQVVGRQWCLRPIVPVPAWLVLGAAAVALSLVVYRGRRIQMRRPYRIALTVLRSLSFLVVASFLLQPTVRLEIERRTPQSLALLVDRSGSMAARDGNGSGTNSRWHRAVATLQACGNRIDNNLTREFYFNDQCREMPWNDLAATGEPPPGARTSIGSALRQVRSMLADRPNTEVILISDGADGDPGDGGELTAATRELKRAGLRVHAVLAGNEHLPAFSVDVLEPDLCAFVGEPARVAIRVRRLGPADSAIELSIVEGDNHMASRRIQLPADRDDVLEWVDLRFDKPGNRHCQFRIKGHDRPAAIIGSRGFDVRVTDQPLRVLYLEHWPRWSFRFLRNAFQRDRRFAAKCVLLGSSEEPATLPAGAADWSGIDVVILGDVALQDLSDAQWQALRAHVAEGGAGLVLAAGPACLPADYLNSPLADLLPFSRMTPEASTSQQPWPLTPTPLGRQHPVLQLQPAGQAGNVWGRLPPLYWCSPIARLKSGAVVLADKPATAEGPACPVVVAQRVGKGSVLFVGTDETWRWRYELGQTYFYRFWAQATMFVGLPHRIQSLAATAPVGSRPAETVDFEQADVRVRPELMRQIARETGGKYVTLSELPTLIEELGRQAPRDRYQKEVACWDRWPTLAVFAALICAEWLLRKKCHLP